MRKNNKKKTWAPIILTCFAIVSILGMSIGYSALNTSLTLSGEAYVRVDTDIRITALNTLEATNGAYENYNSKYTKETTLIAVTLPNLDSTITYEATIANKSDKKYKLVDTILESTINPNIKFELIGIKVGDFIEAHSEIKFAIRQSYNSASLPENKTNNLLIRYTFEQYDPSKNGPNTPELVDGLIPVIYDGTNWVSADTLNKWYNYNEQWWANAVTTTEANRAKYQTPGTVIPMSDINTMWVWIPRYEYKFSNMATGYAGGTVTQPGAIDVNFIDKSATTSSDVANYIVHPAFTFKDQELSGIWVGKFETGSQTECTATSSIANSACDLTTLGVQIKPNISSWRGIRVSTAFIVSREMSNPGNAYGLNNTTTNSHMMKNIEWGAVAYLSQSIYGKYGKSTYSGIDKEVYINNYNGYQTGCSAGSPSATSATICTYTYEKENTGTGASTTGNIYGVYDMSGGAYEYVMGNMKAEGNKEQQSGNQNINNSNSGFTGINYDKTQTSGRAYPESKYYDGYNYSTSNSDHSSRYIKGDVTYEVSQGDGKNNGWYSDYANFVATTYPWFIRSGRFNGAKGAGVFSFSSSSGQAYTDISFRLVLSTTV